MNTTRSAGSRLGFVISLALACACQTSRPEAPSSRDVFDGQGVERYWDVQDQLRAGLPVDETAWHALFATPAYLWQASTPDVQARIRGRMELAFQPDRRALEATIAEAEGYDVIRWNHHRRIRDQREALGEFYDSLLESDIIAEALTIVQRHLPAGTVDVAGWNTPVRLLFFAPDAFSIEGAVVMDLVEALDRGTELKDLLAHEFHHEVYSTLDTLPDLEPDHPVRWVLQALRQLHMEGVADRIDKGSYPLRPRVGGHPGYVEDYNAHYANASQTLKEFDHALRRIPQAPDRQAAAHRAFRLLHFAGHVEGFFMANTIAEAQGPEALLIDTGDPFAFLRRFHAVRPTFSAETLAFLAEVERELRAEEQ